VFLMDVFLSVINLPICFKKPITLGKNFFWGKWGSGEVGRWGSGEVGKWGGGEVGKWGGGEVGWWGGGVVGNFPEFRFDKRYV